MQNLLRSHAAVRRCGLDDARAWADRLIRRGPNLATSRIGRMVRTLQPAMNQLRRRGAT